MLARHVIILMLDIQFENLFQIHSTPLHLCVDCLHLGVSAGVPPGADVMSPPMRRAPRTGRGLRLRLGHLDGRSKGKNYLPFFYCKKKMNIKLIFLLFSLLAIDFLGPALWYLAVVFLFFSLISQVIYY